VGSNNSSITKKWGEALHNIGFSNLLIVIYYTPRKHIQQIVALESFLIVLLKPTYNVRAFNGYSKHGLKVYIYANNKLLFIAKSQNIALGLLSCHYTHFLEILDTGKKLRKHFELWSQPLTTVSVNPVYSSPHDFKSYVDDKHPPTNRKSPVKKCADPQKVAAALKGLQKPGHVHPKANAVLVIRQDNQQVTRYVSQRNAAKALGCSDYPIKSRMQVYDKTGVSKPFTTKFGYDVIFLPDSQITK